MKGIDGQTIRRNQYLVLPSLSAARHLFAFQASKIFRSTISTTTSINNDDYGTPTIFYDNVIVWVDGIEMSSCLTASTPNSI